MTSDRWDKGNGSLRRCRIGRGRCTSAFGAIGLGALLASGCGTSHTYQPMTVAVRDKLTHEPVANAFVHARSLHFFVPVELPLLGEGVILDPFPPASARGVTGDDGTVLLKVIVHHPVQVVVLAAGYDPLLVDLEQHPAIAGASDWLSTDPGPSTRSDPPRLEIRFAKLPTEQKAVASDQPGQSSSDEKQDE